MTDEAIPKKLSFKQQAFVNAYFTCGFNATRAATIAGYGSPGVQGTQLLGNPSIRAEVQRRMADQAMGADEVLARLGRIARGSIEDVLRIEKVTMPRRPTPAEIAAGEDGPFYQEAVIADIDWEKAQELASIGLIKKFRYDRNGRPNIEMYDAIAALDLLGRHHKLFVDRTELSGPNGGALQLESVNAALSKAYDDDRDD